MNIFLRELKAHRWGLVFWCLGMVMLVYSGMAKYAAYEQAGASVEDIIGQLPKGVLAVFGMAGFDLTTAAGFYGVLFLYLAVMAAVHASLLGSGVIAKEERDHTSEFLYTKPASRAKVLTGKLTAGLANLVLFNLATLASSLYFVDFFSDEAPLSREIMLLMVGLFFIQLIFFSIGALVAGTTHRPKSASSIATSIMFLTFLLAFVINLNEELDFLKYVTPFKYFDAGTIMTDIALDPVYVVLSLAIIVLCIVGTYRFYAARDLTV